jgi:hypothetical protein
MTISHAYIKNNKMKIVDFEKIKWNWENLNLTYCYTTWEKINKSYI